MQVLFSYYFHIVFIFWGIWYFVCAQYRNDISKDAGGGAGECSRWHDAVIGGETCLYQSE